MKLASFADLHFRGSDLDVTIAQFRAGLDLARKAGCETVILAGDVFDRADVNDRHAGTGRVLKAVLDCLRPDRSPFRFYILRGNHDYECAGADDALCAFDPLENCTVIREPQWIGFGECVSGFFLPWNWAANDAEETLAGLGMRPDADARRILVHHMQILGLKMNGGGAICESLKFGVAREFLESLPFDHIIGGDFHWPQFGYNGAIRQMSFADEGMPTGFKIYDSESNTAEFIPLDIAPIHVTLRLNEAMDAPPAVRPNTKLRIIPDGWRPSSAFKGEAKRRGIKVEPAQNVKVEAAIRRGETLTAGAQTPALELLRAWLREHPEIEAEESAGLESELTLYLAGEPAGNPTEAEAIA